MRSQDFVKSLPLVKWCDKCQRMVPKIHEHHGLAEKVAMPKIAQDQG